MFNKNLKYFRLRNNMTMNELAKRVGVTNMAISNYEKGIRTPDMETLRKLAAALNISVMDFMSVRDSKLQFVHGAFRKNTALAVNKQDLIRESVEEYFNRFYTIITILGDNVLPSPPRCHVEMLSSNVEDDSRKLRRWLNVAEEGPVGNLVHLLENNGILIYLIDFDDDRFSGINGLINDRPYIVINKSMSAERQRFTIVHELVHLFFSWPDNMADSECEKKSNAIAGAFLLPENDAIRELGVKRSGIQGDMLITAREYGISMQCLAYRAKELRIISEQAYRSFQVQVSKMGWRKNEPSRIEAEESCLFRQLVFRAVAEEEISVQKGAELLQIPFDEVCVSYLCEE